MQTRKLAVPFFLQRDNAVGYTTHMIPVQVAVGGIGSQETPSTRTQAELRSEGYHNRVIVIGESVILKAYNVDPKTIHEAHSSLGFKRHEGTPLQRVHWLAGSAQREFDWIARTGLLRTYLLSGWHNVLESQIGATPDAFENLFYSQSNRHVLNVMRASSLFAQAFYLCGHIKADMVDFHKSIVDKRTAEACRKGEIASAVGSVEDVLDMLDQKNPAEARRFRAAIRSLLAKKVAAPEDEDEVEEAKPAKVDRKKEPNQQSERRAAAKKAKAAALKKPAKPARVVKAAGSVMAQATDKPLNPIDSKPATDADGIN